jgi:hypothetical protein
MALLFNASTDRLTTATFTMPTTGTLCLNVYPNWAQTDSVEHMLVYIAANSGNDQFLIDKFANNFISIGWQTATTPYKVQTTTYTLNQSAWNTICATWDDTANQVKAYLNGSQIGSTVSSLVTWNTAAETLALGNTRSGETNLNMDGRLAEVAIWNRVLTGTGDGTELTNRMNGLLSSCIPSGLVNYWSLNNTTDINDKAGSENLTNSGTTDSGDHPTTTGCTGGTRIFGGSIGARFFD